MSQLTTLLFDFDGTLVESTSKHTEAIIRAFLEHVPNSEVDPDERKAYIGTDYSVTIRGMLAQRGIDDDELVQKIVERIDVHYDALHSGISTVAGSPEFVRAVHAAGFRLGVVSGAGKKHILQTLDQLKLRDLFEIVVAWEDVDAYKPHPEPYLKAMRELGVQASETLAFEDTPVGVEAAWVAEIPVVGILTTFNDEELHKAARTVRDFTELSITDLHTLHQNRDV
ncbi:MAG: HAD family phosphatase [Candidatus Kerfeldbacteria bacterium]|nr:HAD family phosphatase [Candidatus Kerfeldbacteria bacterium]